jgi:hypothetical protein
LTYRLPAIRLTDKEGRKPTNIAVKPEAESPDDVAAMPLAKLNPARVDRFYNDTIWPVFERLRREDPVHFTPESEYGPTGR